uniref:BTB domain-containing protein n=1 Tax=Mycena chlorophos TaxID=658473 RepID=A0ABQ0LNN5_MYCCL|nr:predicted protein [Mycena chlorophos]
MSEVTAAADPPPVELDASAKANPGAVRDERYFYHDGDCMFQVEGVQFKLHRFILCKDKDSMFSDMFNLPRPQDHHVAAGEGEPEIIPIPDETARDFRALCWVHYAMPGELTAQAIRTPDFGKLLSVLRMAHKFDMREFEKWAWEMMKLRPTLLDKYLEGCSEAALARALEIAVKSANQELAEAVEKIWLLGIQGSRPGVRSTYALATAEHLGRRRFETCIYLELRRQLRSVPHLVSPARGFAHFGLDPEQLQKLLVGHAMLSNMLQSPSTAPIPKAATCRGHNFCSGKWVEIYKFNENEPLKSISSIRTAGQATGNPCIVGHLNNVLPKVEDIESAFLGPGMLASQLALDARRSPRVLHPATI